MNTKHQIIHSLDLKPHPEGGYFKEVYRSQMILEKKSLPEEYSGGRNCSTSIYFLLTSDTFSAFHKIHQDEIWHFYKGAPIQIHMISPGGEYSDVIIGNDFNTNQTPQFVVPGNFWFAASTIENDNHDYGLVGCTVAPGFDFEDFILPNRKDLISKFPQHKSIITSFTHH